ncbi:MAG: class I adenylate-forming enzyme family protein [Arcanobacterium sp.]|nr:class I adenylate-forming enzyme family protein [Arcanobacterium sp.]
MPAPNSHAPIYNPAHSLDRASFAHPHRASIHYGSSTYTVEESARITRQIAELLKNKGVVEGDRVMLIARNSPYHLLMYVACARLGAVFVPVSYRIPASQLVDLIGFTESKIVVSDPETAPILREALASSTRLSAAMQDSLTLYVIDDDPHCDGACDAYVCADESSLHTTVQHAPQQHPTSVPATLETTAEPTAGEPASRQLAAYQGVTRTASFTSAAQLHRWKESYSQFPGTLMTWIATRVATTAAHDAFALNRQEYYEGLGVIMFTSGSTGGMKAVPLTHEQLWWGSRNFREGFEYSTWDVELVTVPLTHIGGFNGTTVDLFSHGGMVVVVREFDAGEVLSQIEQHHVAMMFGVPTVYAAMLAHPDFPRTDISSLTRPLIGGAVVPQALLHRMTRAGLAPLNVWGMTEISASGFYLSAENLGSHAGSIGRPFAHIEARIIDPETGEDSTSGELAVRGPSVMEGYWKSPEDTAKHFVGDWLLTGDLVTIDDAGYVWVTGRRHNLINTGGEKVSPEEVEATLNHYPGVSSVVVVGLADDLWGERIAAALLLEPGAQAPQLHELQDFAARSLPRFELPRELRIVQSFPVNPNGKIDRQAVVSFFDE